jgi:hypothetical protein
VDTPTEEYIRLQKFHNIIHTNNADVERVLWWLLNFSKLVALSIPGSNDTGLVPLGVLKENVYKNNPHTLE